jgi:chemotaxis protein CheD
MTRADTTEYVAGISGHAYEERGVDRNGVPIIYVRPMGLVAVDGDSPRTLMTVLGSCVSVCLWDRSGGGGGMNHFLLPSAPLDGPGSTRYGDVAIPMLICRLTALGARRSALRAKVFGGAHILGTPPPNGRSIGGDNARLALSTLAAEGIQVVADDLGGARGRKLAFSTTDGAVLLWRL